MIDTVILRIHNIKKNSKLVRNLELYNKDLYTTEIAKVSVDDLAAIHNKRKRTPVEIIEVLKHERKGEFLIKTQVGKQMNYSSHYYFTFYINYTRDFIEFNFSIPKYKFGTNILMFVKHDIDRLFNMYDCQTLEYNLKNCYKLLTEFLKKFFKWEFIFCDIDLKDVEINRIDVCFNQVFKSKADALLYLDYQKRLKKKYARDEQGVMREYATSLMYVTKRYSAKIYHKGSEYASNDIKEHKKFNRQKGKEYFKTEKFQSFSDRMLRYELTIRNSYLNYLQKNYIFRKDCKWWKMMYRDYTRVESINQKNDRISKKIGSLKTVEEKLKYTIQHPYEKKTQDLKLGHKVVSKLISRRRYFMLETDMESDMFNIQTVNYNNDFAYFSKGLLDLCLKKLTDFIHEFQIKELPTDEIVRQKIQNFNKSYPSKKIPIAEMMNFYPLLVKHGSFKEAAKYSNYSRATLFRYILRFRIIGITENSIKPIEKSFGIPKAPLDLREYHSTIIYDMNLLRGIKITEASAIV